MRRIVLISDTHGKIPQDVESYIEQADEVWHAGDLGCDLTSNAYPGRSVRAVYGNIDDHLCRSTWPEYTVFTCEELKVLMIHIGGYPGRYNSRMRTLIEEHLPHIVVVGHSHILKIARDHKYNHYHFNPGACGFHGFHRIRTFLRFKIDGSSVQDMEVVELSNRSQIKASPGPVQSHE